MFNECKKRQRELYKGEELHRCIEPTSEKYRETVEPDDCAHCPVRKFAMKKEKCDLRNVQELKSKTAPPPGTLIQLSVLNNPGDKYPECVYRVCAGEDCKCNITGHKVDPQVCNRCNEDVRDVTAGGLSLLKNYWGAVRKWIAAGRPVRSDEQIKKIFDKFCKTCDRYDPVNHSCKVCGCKVSHDSKPLSNKLKMATEGCPLGLFSPEVESK